MNPKTFYRSMKTVKKIFFGTILALTFGLAATLKAQNIYVTSYINNTIGEYGLDGSTINASLISGLPNNPVGMAISGNDLFVASFDGGRQGSPIGEYTTSGATVNAGLISGPVESGGLSGALDVVVSGNNLFASSQGLSDTDVDGPVGAYTTSGVVVNSGMIYPIARPWGLAISGNDLFVSSQNSGTIGEYTTSGAIVNTSLISGLNNPFEMVISGNDLFVANYGSGTVGEYTLSGAVVNASLISGLDQPTGIAILGNDLFVSNTGSGTVGEYTTSGATVNSSLISGLAEPIGIAISVPEPSSIVLAGLGGLSLLLFRRRHG
jgi:hypothetical protein